MRSRPRQGTTRSDPGRLPVRPGPNPPPGVGFPRFKTKRKTRPSIRFTTGAFRCEHRHAVLPRIGRVKLHEDGARLADLVAAGTARVTSVTVRFERGRWHAAFTVEQDVTRPAPVRPDAVAGVDLGIKTLAVLATDTGETFEVPNPRHHSGALRKVRRLSRHVADASFAEIRRQLTYKTTWHGGTLIVADRWFASSKTCSECGAVKTKLALSKRAYACEACGTVLDRDVNAAVNLARLAARGPGQQRTWSRPEDRARPAGGCETSTRHRTRGSDRDRPNARRDGGMSAHERSVATVS